ncbi:glyoxalase [Aggregatimonas sangjinii]|uniref:Glyoxalase n=1 Tax=Aggregatimonas sangjinii TaxID=2583587 RepID=A0A5B7SUA7_9FLAO|nr:VOC family protein [Aggregatimonas sangjinii]QCX00703.1 glyoxalase [Aggregatimonas sangjinii]
MDYKAKSIRTFIGAKNYTESRRFYKELGFEEIKIGHDMCFFRVNENIGFYLQKAYVRDWVDNSMIFLEVDDVEKCYQDLLGRDLHKKYAKVRLSEIKRMEWGSELFLHDPSGILWHFGEFNN